MTGQTAAQTARSTGTAIPERILFGRSDVMQAVRDRIERVAQTRVPVLIVGESGVGKEVVARYVHSQSHWTNGPFMRINCPGVRAGSLMGSAGEGTLFLDGIGELDFSLQSKLLQFLQDRNLTPVGTEALSSNTRVICSASRPLETEIESGRFRRDLYYQLSVVIVHVPPLRQRRLDIPDLIDYFLHSFSHEFGRVPEPMRQSTRSLLVSNDWPGNIRQLENVIKRYVILDSEEAILTDLCGHVPGAEGAASDHHVSLKHVTRSAKRDIERKVILEALSANQWNRKRTAEALDISYRALLYKIKQGGLPSKKSVTVTSVKH